jgi:hypothetical protein
MNGRVALIAMPGRLHFYKDSNYKVIFPAVADDHSLATTTSAYYFKYLAHHAR